MTFPSLNHLLLETKIVWASPEIETRYLQLCKDAQEAARQASKPYADEAAQLFASFTRIEYLIPRPALSEDQ